MKILGIETSCDETAVAIVDDEKNILSHVLNSQIKLHEKFGGVVPEIAARSHVEVLDGLILQALKEANLKFEDIDAFAATSGPGLLGGVIVGMTAAKTLASIFKKPFLAINHLEGHALTVRLTNDVKFPYLLLLISGGHCQILLAHGIGNYQKIGETIDDALGEAFDKVAQMLGLPYPGGPAVEKLAREGDENRFKFSRPLLDSKDEAHRFAFSFSGLKTAVRREIEKLIGENFSHLTSPQKINEKDKADICASFQHVVCEIILNRLDNVFISSSSLTSSLSLNREAKETSPLNRKSTETSSLNRKSTETSSLNREAIRGSHEFDSQDPRNAAHFKDDDSFKDDNAIKNNDDVKNNVVIKNLILAGGVAANRYIFSRLQNWAEKNNLNVITPPLSLCTDNAAMIAWVGVEKMKLGIFDQLNFKPKARWELDSLSSNSAKF